jgi:CoA:oxalate CoA-transferase
MIFSLLHLAPAVNDFLVGCFGETSCLDSCLNLISFDNTAALSPPDAMTTRQPPLRGLRVLDFSRVLAGPFCTALLADVGAEVIKVEPPGGDDYRHIGPFKNEESSLFMLINRGKKSIVLDLKSEEGAELARELAAHCDVVVENYTPGVTTRLGIDYPSLCRVNPKLVYASVSGFGQDGPLARRPSYDLVAQAMSGMMSITGEADGAPMRSGEPLADLGAGLYAAWGVMVALFARDRTGHGTHVDVAMFDTLFSMLPTSLAQLLFAEQRPTRVGNRHPLSTPFGSFRAGDGHVVIAVANNALFQRLATAMDRPALAEDARFASDEERTRHEPAVRAEIEQWAADKSVARVVEILDAHGVPAAPIWDVEEAVASAQTSFRKLLMRTSHPVAGDIDLMEQPVHYSHVERGKLARSPLLGEHTDGVLGELLEIDSQRIRSLKERRIIA